MPACRRGCPRLIAALAAITPPLFRLARLIEQTPSDQRAAVSIRPPQNMRLRTPPASASLSSVGDIIHICRQYESEAPAIRYVAQSIELRELRQDARARGSAYGSLPSIWSKLGCRMPHGPPVDVSLKATAEQRLSRELVSLDQRFTRREHYESFLAALTDILRRLGATRHPNDRTIVGALNELLDRLDELEHKVSALLGPPWLGATPVWRGAVRDGAEGPTAQVRMSRRRPRTVLGTLQTHIHELAKSSMDEAWEVSRHVAAAHPRRLREMRRHVARLCDALHDELHSRLALTLALYQRRLARASERYGLVRQQVAASWWRKAGDRIMGSWTEARPRIEFSPHLTAEDMSLADMWGSPRRRSEARDRKRRYAARRAERSAMLFYEQFHLNVKDVSIGQLTQSGDPWQTCDLLVDQSPVDVKNVRGRGAFGGYVLKSPKQYGDREVRICGVVTDFLDGRQQDAQRRLGGGYDNRGNFHAVSSQTILGETSNEGLKAVAEQAKELADELGLSLDVAEMASWQVGLGAWHFDFNTHHYRDPTSFHFGTLVQADRLRGPLGRTRDWAAGLSASRNGPPIGTGSRAVRLMRTWFRGGLSRPRIFLFALLYLVAAAREGSYVDGRTKNELLRLIFIDQGEVGRRHPLGLYDPIGVIHAVIQTLDRLVRLNQDVLRDVRQLRLRGNGILQAYGELPKHGLAWFTLLAYCGDCGRSPLWAGDLRLEETPRRRGNDVDGFVLCRKCRRLRCCCGFCSYECR